jgi:hypothetical protein
MKKYFRILSSLMLSGLFLLTLVSTQNFRSQHVYADPQTDSTLHNCEQAGGTASTNGGVRTCTFCNNTGDCTTYDMGTQQPTAFSLQAACVNFGQGIIVNGQCQRNGEPVEVREAATAIPYSDQLVSDANVVVPTAIINSCNELPGSEDKRVCLETAARCIQDQRKKFLGILPTWYVYVKDYGVIISGVSDTNHQFSCGFTDTDRGTGEELLVTLREHAVQVVLALIDILIRLGGIVAVVFIMLGGYKYITSQGDGNGTKQAMTTIINAAIGLVIVIFASAIVSFVGGRLG